MDIEAIIAGLAERGIPSTYEYPGALVIPFANSIGRYQVWTGLTGWEYGSISVLDGGEWSPVEGEAGTAEPRLRETDTEVDVIVDAWAAWIEERVEPVLVRGVCACGFVTEEDWALELWNGYGDHVDSAQLTDPQCRVSVWTLSDGTITIADNRAHFTV